LYGGSVKVQSPCGVFGRTIFQDYKRGLGIDYQAASIIALS
jgi:hypothetical protein